MATRTIASPGVEINEVDLSIVARPAGATNTFITGFASQGPTDEIINVGSLSEFEDTFGTPTNSAERYLYHTARQILTQSPTNLLVTRMPYGSGAGEGFANQYTALVYPISADATTYESASSFRLLPPKSILLTDEQYQKIIENDVVWGTTPSNYGTVINSFEDLATNAGVVVLDSSKTAINNRFEGVYVVFADNSENNPASDFVSVTGVKAVNSIVNGNYQTFVDVPSSRFNFTLTQAFSSAGTSISQIVEQFPRDFDFSSSFFNDSLTLMVFKVRTSVYGQDTVVLDSIVTEGYTGSLYSNRTQNDVNGGPAVSFFLDNVVNKTSQNVRVITNPYISTRGNWLQNNGNPAKSVRVANDAKNLYSKGVYISDTNTVAGDVGNVPLKLQRILNQIDNLDIDLDVVAEAGLGTIWTGAQKRWEDSNYGNSVATNPKIFDETYNVDTDNLKLQTNNPVGGIASTYQEVVSQFISFADITRKDHVFIADPLRYIFIQGSNTKVSRNKNYVFSKDVYWPLKNLYSGIKASSYATVYGNWINTNDLASSNRVWVPASGYVAAVFATTSQTAYPWTAPAGFNRGTLTNVLDVAINPTQKQRDLIYRINVNPIAFFPGDGFVIYGQKTLYTKPSAFDRINVRRLFLTLEKTTKNLLKFYVFEPNTFTTRTRLANALTPIFNQAKNNDGLFDYRIVCDERNNTPDVIDNNELKISIYIQPVRTAEFILADFIATRTGVNFSELIS
jgi:hypothetical protein